MEPPVNKRRRDWFWILRTLMGKGISMAEVGRACNRRAETVQAWAEGSEPKESDARVVLALLAKYAPLEYARHQAQFEIRLTAAMAQPQGALNG